MSFLNLYIKKSKVGYKSEYCFKSSVKGQKGESQNGCYKKTKHVKFSEKRALLPPDTHTWGKNVRFSENLLSFVFL